MLFDDDEILAAIPEMARETGVFAEPASAVSLAALRGALNADIIGDEETVVLLVTGNGLKDVDSAMLSVGKPRPLSTSAPTRRSEPCLKVSAASLARSPSPSYGTRAEG